VGLVQRRSRGTDGGRRSRADAYEQDERTQRSTASSRCPRAARPWVGDESAANSTRTSRTRSTFFHADQHPRRVTPATNSLLEKTLDTCPEHRATIPGTRRSSSSAPDQGITFCSPCCFGLLGLQLVIRSSGSSVNYCSSDRFEATRELRMLRALCGRRRCSELCVRMYPGLVEVRSVHPLNSVAATCWVCAFLCGSMPRRTEGQTDSGVLRIPLPCVLGHS